MTIFHFKHSYLNWSAIPYRRRMICVYAIFHHFLNTFFWLLDFCLDSIEFFKCMTWQSIFFYYFLFFSFSWSVYSGQQCMSYMTFQIEASLLMWGLFWEVGLLVQSCLYRFCPKRRLWLKSVPEKWVFFGQHVPRHQSGYFRISRS